MAEEKAAEEAAIQAKAATEQDVLTAISRASCHTEIYSKVSYSFAFVCTLPVYTASVHEHPLVKYPRVH